MREEFHGEEGKGYQQLYGWETISANVWLPSLMELVGHDPNQYWEANGCYVSAMQGLNLRINAWIDVKGGTQFAYFRQYNTSGGGQKIWEVCSQQTSWLRSPCCWDITNAWIITNATRGDVPACIESLAVHPAVEDRQSIAAPTPCT